MIKMKKLILFLMLILVTSVVLAQENKDILEIKKVVESFLKSNNLGDIDSAMQSFSVNYSDIRGDKVEDYAKFRSILKNVIDNISKKYVDYSRSDLRILKSDIQGDKATLEIEYSWKGFNLDTLQEDRGKKKRQVSLRKENGSWKITQWIRLPQSK